MEKSQKLSILMPVYNEEKTVQLILQKVIDAKLPPGLEREIIIVDDHSKDNTYQKIMEFKEKNPDMSINVFQHKKNQGKGAALRTGMKYITGEYTLIQDADLEYNPAEYPILLKPLLSGVADVVYGSRFITHFERRVHYYWHYLGNRFLTFLSNMFTNLCLSDMETCFKVFRSEIIKKINIKENRFGFEPEITAKISKIPDIKIYEVGISYHGRTYKEGKKISWKDGLRAFWCILKYNL